MLFTVIKYSLQRIMWPQKRVLSITKGWRSWRTVFSRLHRNAAQDFWRLLCKNTCALPPAKVRGEVKLDCRVALPRFSVKRRGIKVHLPCPRPSSQIDPVTAESREMIQVCVVGVKNSSDSAFFSEYLPLYSCFRVELNGATLKTRRIITSFCK